MRPLKHIALDIIINKLEIKKKEIISYLLLNFTYRIIYLYYDCFNRVVINYVVFNISDMMIDGYEKFMTHLDKT